jgi:hypothetical protein
MDPVTAIGTVASFLTLATAAIDIANSIDRIVRNLRHAKDDASHFSSETRNFGDVSFAVDEAVGMNRESATFILEKTPHIIPYSRLLLGEMRIIKRELQDIEDLRLRFDFFEKRRIRSVLNKSRTSQLYVYLNNVKSSLSIIISLVNIQEARHAQEELLSASRAVGEEAERNLREKLERCQRRMYGLWFSVFASHWPMTFLSSFTVKHSRNNLPQGSTS